MCAEIAGMIIKWKNAGNVLREPATTLRVAEMSGAKEEENARYKGGMLSSAATIYTFQ